MDVRFYIGCTLLIYWIYLCIAEVTQQHAVIEYFDKRYISEARAFTARRRRGDAYRTNVTIVSQDVVDNNVTIKVVANVKSVGNIVFHDMKVCDGFKIDWIRQMRNMYSNFTDCPILPGKYLIFNLEIPPKNFPLPVPKGEGTLHMYVYLDLTRKMHLILHAVVKVSSS